MEIRSAYSVRNGLEFEWSSLTGQLSPTRVELLDKYICGQEILDAGCGGGAFVEFLGSKGLHVTGLDYHAVFLDVARARPNARGTYVEGDITALPFPDQHFDCTYCFDVLEHVDDSKALSELIRVTRRRIIVAVPASDDNYVIGGGLTFHHYRDLTHLRTYTEQTLETLFRSLNQHHYRILPELPVDLGHIAINHLAPARTTNPIKFRVRNAYNSLLRRILRYARYATIYSGWAAVIDLVSETSPAESTI